jgi:hypothetical protein
MFGPIYASSTADDDRPIKAVAPGPSRSWRIHPGPGAPTESPVKETDYA